MASKIGGIILVSIGLVLLIVAGIWLYVKATEVTTTTSSLTPISSSARVWTGVLFGVGVLMVIGGLVWLGLRTMDKSKCHYTPLIGSTPARRQTLTTEQVGPCMNLTPGQQVVTRRVATVPPSATAF